MEKKIHADQRYLDGLVQNDAAIINEIYRKCSAKVKSFVLFNNGNADDAADIFQECLIDLYKQVELKKLTLTCPFEPFFLLICKRKWLNELKKRSLLPVTNNEDDLLHHSEDTFELTAAMEKQRDQAKIFKTAFAQLGDRCQEIISWAMKGEAQEKVAEALGVTYGYLRKKKSECMAALVKIIQPYLADHD